MVLPTILSGTSPARKIKTSWCSRHSSFTPFSHVKIGNPRHAKDHWDDQRVMSWSPSAISACVDRLEAVSSTTILQRLKVPLLNNITMFRNITVIIFIRNTCSQVRARECEKYVWHCNSERRSGADSEEFPKEFQNGDRRMFQRRCQWKFQNGFRWRFSQVGFRGSS